MKYNFDEIIDRKNTNSLKYDFAVERGKQEDILPLWIADMDFKVPDCVTKALETSVAHGIFGYTEVKEDYFKPIHDWFVKYHNWNTEFSWLVKTPGIVFAIGLAIRAFTKEDEGVLIQQPVYYPFSETVIANDRTLAVNSLINKSGHYEIDFEDFEKQIIEKKVKLFLLCSPHNPVGRVWKIEELKRMGEICLKHGVVILSDEIHCDFALSGHKHTVFASISEEFAMNSIICTSPSKTFNLAGLQVSNNFIKNEEIRRKFYKALDAAGYSQLNTLGLAACKAAYEDGEEWLAQLKEYLNDNLTFLRDFLKERLPLIKLVEPEGTYLIWLDFHDLNITKKELAHLIVNKANLWLDSGQIFGKEGLFYERINIACPREVLRRALEQLEKAVKN
jgi:cystathionine beta-lyase